MPKLTELERLEKYHELFTLVVENPRIMPKGIAKRLRYSGQGKARSTIAYHLKKMYEEKISMRPQICLRTFKRAQITTYLCKKSASRGLFSMLKKIDKDPNINYALCLSSSDFFLTSRDKNLHVEKYGLTIKEKSSMFTPLYPIPKNWNLDINNTFQAVLETPFEKGRIKRKIHNNLNWSTLDWKIYDFIKGDIRQKFTVVARSTDTTSKTVKDHFYRQIMPNCIQINYFFPKGYHNYLKAFIRINSSFERSIVEGLRKLPSTNYVFPLEKSIVLILFHESIVKTLEFLEKMEKMAIIDGYLLYSILASTG